MGHCDIPATSDNLMRHLGKAVTLLTSDHGQSSDYVLGRTIQLDDDGFPFIDIVTTCGSSHKLIYEYEDYEDEWYCTNSDETIRSLKLRQDVVPVV